MPLCSQTTTSGAPCRSHAMHGSDRCASHLGRSRQKPLLELDDELVDGLLTMLRAGNYVEVACRAVGLPYRTFAHWVRLGATTSNPTYVTFREQVEQARAVGEARNVAAIASAARESWQAAAWLLERSYPDRWARPSQRGDVEPQHVRTPDPADPFAEVDELAARRQRAS